MKICANCKHYDPCLMGSDKIPTLSPFCTRKTYRYQDPITGEFSQRGHVYAENERKPNDPKPLKVIQAALSFDKRYLEYRCGPEARYYEAA